MSTDEASSFLRGDLITRAEARARERGEDLEPSETSLWHPVEGSLISRIFPRLCRSVPSKLPNTCRR